VLKNSTLNVNELKSYRPVSNLPYASKLIEKVVSYQLDEHCAANKINMYYQSAYKKCHSTETALTRVQNDILRAVDSQGGAILVLLDLSAAFDTIDHSVLLNTLRTEIGVCGTALRWFASYLEDRHQSVKIGKAVSTQRPVPFGVPQGSVLGPQLFSVYTSPLHHIIETSGMAFHLYADDTQLYLAFSPKNSVSTANVLQIIEECTINISTWMRSHYLKLNSDKTELLVVTKPSLRNHQMTCLNICGNCIEVSDCVRNLGVHFDTTFKMDSHIRKICKRAYYQIHLIHKVRKSITEDAARTLMQANVTSLLDYCNSLLIGLPQSLLNLLQRVQNCAARVVKCVPKTSHITPILKELHWLPVRFRVEYKVILMTYKALNGLAPPYISDLLQPYRPVRTLRSMNDNLLSSIPYQCKSYGGRSFAVMAPSLWNALPSHMRHMTSVPTFKKCLKTYLFEIAFN
jgi:hypothetical protein